MAAPRNGTLQPAAFALKLLVALVFCVAAQPAAAAWMSGRMTDSSGMTYLAVINDAATGERVELNCTPAGQAFVALSWNALAAVPGEGALTLRFLVDGSYRFVAPARYRLLDKGWAAAELATSDILGPLTQALLVGRGELEVEARRAGGSLVRAVFDMRAAPENIGRYRAYCRL